VQIVQLAVYIPLVLFGIGYVVGFLLRLSKVKDSKDKQFLVIMLAMTVAALGAEAIRLEGIIGAFLIGLALNRAVRHSAAREDLVFLGNTLFIPIFFIMVGFLIDLHVFVETLVSRPAMVACVVGGLIVAKLLAAIVVSKPFGYSRDQCLITWSLTLPQVAATLAAALVAYEAKNSDGKRLIDEPALNSVIVMMVATSLLGPILTEVFGKRLPEAHVSSATTDSSELGMASGPPETSGVRDTGSDGGRDPGSS
jgi:Kef-type K+ transport system membrane component KefB